MNFHVGARHGMCLHEDEGKWEFQQQDKFLELRSAVATLFNSFPRKSKFNAKEDHRWDRLATNRRTPTETTLSKCSDTNKPSWLQMICYVKPLGLEFFEHYAEPEGTASDSRLGWRDLDIWTQERSNSEPTLLLEEGLFQNITQCPETHELECHHHGAQ